VRYEQALERTAAPAAHGIHDERLVSMMRNLDRLRDERLPKAFDVREEQDRQALEVARVAQAMADSAAQIPAAAPADLDAAQLAEFRSLATALQHLCAGLAEAAPRLTNTQRRARLADIDATCNECHGRFRIPGVTRDGG
jgi:cytochrome c556